MSADEPGQRSFFKYAAPETALAILKSQTVRYSSPLCFNDPFDIQTGLHLNFDIDSLPAKVLDRIQALAMARENPKVDPDNPWGQIVLKAREYYPTHGFPRDRWEQMTAQPFLQLPTEAKTLQVKVKNYWREMLPRMRVFCVSEDRDNLLMWVHYAKDHSGVVFEFLSLPQEDNPLSVARRVHYVDSPPSFYTEAEWVDDILTIHEFDHRELSRRYVYFKSAHWSYEREWRTWYLSSPASEGHYDDMPIRKSELAAVYIGCKAEASFAESVISLTRASFPNAKLYRASRGEDAYALEYKEI
ncbi:MAG: DUF2971 domain-containing protein [Nitrospira sp.]